MRTGKVILSGAHFFCVLQNALFSTHIGISLIVSWGHFSAISLQCQKEQTSKLRIALVVAN